MGINTLYSPLHHSVKPSAYVVFSQIVFSCTYQSPDRLHICSPCHSLVRTSDDSFNVLTLAQDASLKRYVKPSAHHIHPSEKRKVVLRWLTCYSTQFYILCFQLVYLPSSSCTVRIFRWIYKSWASTATGPHTLSRSEGSGSACHGEGAFVGTEG